MLLRTILRLFGYEIRRIEAGPVFAPPAIPGGELYRPLYSPWAGEAEFARFFRIAEPRTLVSADRCYVLYRLLLQALRVEGDVWECGVYKGGTAAMMAAVLGEKAPGRKLFLFDTFAGMPEPDASRDWHRQGDFSDTSRESVAAYVGHRDTCTIREGRIPATFAGLETARIALAHVDVDIYRSVKDCLAFIWPRLSRGGFVVCDDYGFPTCPGARAAVDEYFAGTAAVPLCLPTGQAIVFKSAA
jgi:O-methyltransferase